ncbi:hypothetical protein OROMI_014339 [Orobanche minor]
MVRTRFHGGSSPMITLRRRNPFDVLPVMQRLARNEENQNHAKFCNYSILSFCSCQSSRKIRSPSLDPPQSTIPKLRFFDPPQSTIFYFKNKKPKPPISPIIRSTRLVDYQIRPPPNTIIGVIDSGIWPET